MDCSSIRRGDIVFADLSPVIGSEQGGPRPLVVIQNNIGNKHSPTVIVASITTVLKKTRMVTHVDLKASKYKFIKRDSVVLLEQLRTIDKDRISDLRGFIDEDDMKMINKALAISVGLDECVRSRREAEK